jgi:hypothetical protein
MPSEVPIADSRIRDSKVADRRNTNQRVWLFCRRQNLREERDSHPSGPRWCSARLDLLTFQTLRERERERTMQRRQFSGERNKLDLNDRVQVRIVRKRLKVSNEQLASLVRTAGGSIAAVSKEAGHRRRLTLPGSRMPPAEVIPSVKEAEITPEALS